MRILIIRHGDPDYSIDSLTEKGWKEAEFLSEKLTKMNIKEFYVSPLGRAKDTASCTLKKLNRTAKECLWLKEFDSPIWRPDRDDKKMIPWDWLPQDWTKDEQLFHYDQWYNNKNISSENVRKDYEMVVDQFDKLLEEHGYIRNGHIYQVKKANTDTIVLFCHFGLECVLLSHILNVSPFVLWHGACAAPSSVTTLITEERRKGIASFRMSSFGDISHLYANNELPAFAARFCEVYDSDERHD